MTTTEPTPASCLDCKRRYGDQYGFPDLVVSDETWAAIHPEGKHGLLCPSCMCARAHTAGVAARAEFRSGPFAVMNDGPLLDVSEPTPEAVEELARVVHSAPRRSRAMHGRGQGEACPGCMDIARVVLAAGYETPAVMKGVMACWKVDMRLARAAEDKVKAVREVRERLRLLPHPNHADLAKDIGEALDLALDPGSGS